MSTETRASRDDASEPTGPDGGPFEDLIEEITGRLEAGEPIDVEEYARRHPEHEGRLRRLLPSLRAMAGLGRSTADGDRAPFLNGPPDGRLLGDFRIVREVGRGGMGVVYEAEQVSLGRRVALKVLPFAGALDPRQLRRFHLEAQAAAGLHHANVVPVYSVGCDRGVHYYAMQFIDGRSLAEVIAEMRAFEAGVGRTPDATRLALDRRSDCRGDVEPSDAGFFLTNPGTGPPGRDGVPETAGRESHSGGSSRTGAYCRDAARLALQAAEALAYAHEQAVLHRDVKPSNLLVDSAGKLWIADFGLARFDGGHDLTATGDLVGTLCYMSPEQAVGRRAVVDHRTDIYSLGVTLYELLTLRPAFDGDDRREILRRIAEVEPPRPRRLNTSVPADLETVLLKAIDKDPAGRYLGAADFAADLRRFLDGLPVAARRPTFLDRIAKWSRRHAVAVTASLATLAVATTVLASGVVLIWREREATRRALGRAESSFRVAEEQRKVAERAVEQARRERDRAVRAAASERTFREAAEAANRRIEERRAADMLGVASLHAQIGRIGLEMRDRPDDPALPERRAYLAARAGLFDQAAADWERVVSTRPEEPWHWYRLGHALLYLGEYDRARERWREMRDRFGPGANHQVAEMIAKTYLLHPKPDGDLPAAAVLADQALTPGHWAGHRPWFLLTSALGAYRSSDFARAADRIAEYRDEDQTVAAGHAGYREILALLIEAMARHRLGEDGAAAEAFAKAGEALKGVPQPGQKDIDDVEGWLVHQIVLREAEDLFRDRQPAAPAVPPDR